MGIQGAVRFNTGYFLIQLILAYKDQA